MTQLKLVATEPVKLGASYESPAQPENDPVFLASEAANLVPGDKARLDDALVVTARLGEFDSEQKKADARGNLGLQVIDLGTF